MALALVQKQDLVDMDEVPALLNADVWATASAVKRQRAETILALVAGLAECVQKGATVNTTVHTFMARHEAGMLGIRERYLCEQIGKGLSAPTLKRWIAAYVKHGKTGLLPKHTGRVRKDYGWEVRAVELYNIPSKPGFAAVASRLRMEGHASATDSRVSRFLEKLPATLGKYSPARVGPHLHKLTRRTYKRRDLSEVLVGEIYAGDGHTADCYVAHPNTGKPYRPELTVFIDIKSSYVAGWYMSEAESAHSTLFAISHAMRAHNHVPAWLYIDRGAGYKAKLMSDASNGFYSRFDMGVIGAIPGNPHGKGWIENFFRWVRDDHDKLFFGGDVYCGDDMAPEHNRRLSADLAMGRRTLPSLRQYVESFAGWLEHYHNEPSPKLGGRTPAQVWAELVPVSVELDAASIIRPRQEATVRRQEVRLHNRHYFAEALALYDAKRVQVEYDLHDDRAVWIFDDKGRFVVEARLVNKISVLPMSRLEEGRDRRLEGQRKRLERRLQEIEGRRADPITADAAADGISALEAAHAAEPLQMPTKPMRLAPKRAKRDPLVIDLDVTDPEQLRSLDLGKRAADDNDEIDILDWKG